MRQRFRSSDNGTRYKLVPGTVLLAWIAAGCGSIPWMPGRVSEERVVAEQVASSKTRQQVAYHLRVGDELEVALWGPVNLTRKIQVREDGTFSLPVIGDIPAAGRSVKELEGQLQERLTKVYASMTAQQGTETESLAQRVISAKELQNVSYRLRLGDELDVSVWGHEALSRKVQIREDGTVSLPLIGNVRAIGRSLQEVEQEIQERLNRDYIVNPQVTVWLAGARFSVLGQVERPGSYPIEGTVDLLTAISQAGGISAAGSNHIEVIRVNIQEKVVVRTNLDLILQGLEPNITILPRDTIYVKKSPSENLQVLVRLLGAKYAVLGEVERPGSYPLEGTVDLLTAISQAGGLTKFGSPRVEVIRGGDQEKVSMRANINWILQGKESNVSILPRDTIYVRRRLF